MALKGEFKGLPVDEKFDAEYQAAARRDDLEYGNKELIVEEVEVEIPF